MPNQRNKDTVEVIKEKAAKAKTIVLTDYKGLSVNQINELRSNISDADAEMAIAKNSLIEIALREADVETSEVKEHLKGQTAVVFGYADVVAPIKAIVDFAKQAELPTIKAGILEGVFNTADKIQLLSQLPSKEELLAKVVGGLKAPITGFVNVLGGPQRGLVHALSAIADKKKE